jgi:phosphate-selective porin OprO/OprP
MIMQGILLMIMSIQLCMAAAPDLYPDVGLLYRNEQNPIVQEVWSLGRYHGQNYWTDGSNGSDDGWEDRRARVGGQARLFNRLTVHAQMVSGPDIDPVYNGFTELWASWRFTDAFNLTVGQQKHRFTHDRNVSSRYLQTLERGMLTNMFSLDYTPAVTASGMLGLWSYYTGVFSNGTGQNIEKAFFKPDSGYSIIGSVTRDLGNIWYMDTAHMNVSFIHSDVNSEATNLNRFDQGLSAALILTSGSYSLVTEATTGIGNGDAIGLSIQPGYFITPWLQTVGRYQIAGSTDNNGLRAQRRYERTGGLSTGDEYHAGYTGLNFYIAQHRLKVMTGVEYATLGGEDVVTASVAVRLFWGPQSRGPFPMAMMLESD